MKLACVVCGAPTTEQEALYANTWERARRRFPCCSEPCCRAFNPDVHWLPAVEPEPAPDDEQQRLLAVARERLEHGDNPSVIARELLLAGVAVPALTKVITSAYAQSSESARDARQRTGLGVLLGIFTGVFVVAPKRDRRNPDALEQALDDLERWRDHWPPK